MTEQPPSDPDESSSGSAPPEGSGIGADRPPRTPRAPREPGAERPPRASRVAGEPGAERPARAARVPSEPGAERPARPARATRAAAPAPPLEPPPGVTWPGEIAVEDAAGTPCVTVAAEDWLRSVQAARDAGYDYLDWLSAVDQHDADPAGVDVVVHLVALPSPGQSVRRLLLRTRAAGGWEDRPSLASLTPLFAGVAWHERETHEMFGVEFEGFDDGSGAGLRPLLLPDGFEGYPLRKSFQLAARAAKAWPGAKEPGESEENASPSRRKALPPGVPDPATWGPRQS